MLSFIKKNVSLLLFFLTLFSDTILSSNFLFSLSVKSEIGKSLSDTLSDDRSDALQFKKQVKGSDFTVQSIDTNGSKSIGESDSAVEDTGTLIFVFLFICFLTIVFFPLGWAGFSTGSFFHMIFIFLGSITLLFAVISFIVIFIIRNKKKTSKFLVAMTLFLLYGTVLYLLFALVFPIYMFLFVFSMIAYGILGLIVLYLLSRLIVWLRKKVKERRIGFEVPPEPVNPIPISENSDSSHVGLGSQVFNSMLLLKVSLFVTLVGLSLFLLQEFLFPAVSMLSFISYGFFGLSALLLILFVGTLSYRSLKERSLRPEFGEGKPFSFLILFFVGLALILTGTLLYLFVESVALPIFIVSMVLGGVFSLLNLFKFIQKFRNRGGGPALEKFALYNKTSALGLLSFLVATSLFILYLLSYGSFTTVLLPMLVSVGIAFFLLLVRIVQLARKYRKITAENTDSSGVIEFSLIVLSSRITLSWIMGLHFFVIGLIFLGLSFMLSVVLQVPIVSMLSIFYTVFVLQIFFVYFFLGKKQGSSSGGVFSRILNWFKDQSAKSRAKFNQDRRNSVRSNKSFSGAGKTDHLYSDSDSETHEFYQESKTDYRLLWVGLALTGLFIVIALTAFSPGNRFHYAFLLLASILLIITVGGSIGVTAKKRKFLGFILFMIFSILFGTGFYLLFAFAFPNYFFFFVFSMLNFAFVGFVVFCVILYLMIFSIAYLIKKILNKLEERRIRLRANVDLEHLIPVDEDLDPAHRGLGSNLFNDKVFLTVSFLLGFLGAALVLLEQFLFPAISLLSFVSYGFLGLSALLLLIFVVNISYRSLKNRSLRPDFGQGKSSTFLNMFFVGLALILTGTLLYLFVDSVGLPILIVSTVLGGGVFSLQPFPNSTNATTIELL